jgi:hypothetical protein
MLLRNRFVRSLLMSATLMSPLLIPGCAVRVGPRVYDPYYRDYHVWNDTEIGYYHRWYSETGRPYREFRQLAPAERREYWTWRHAHPNAG